MKLEIKKGLNKREKRMLFGGAIIGSLAIMIQFVILPLNTELEDKTAEFTALDMERQEIEMRLAQERFAQFEYDEAFEEYEALDGLFLRESLSNQVGREITILVEDHEFIALSQSISPHSNFMRGDITPETAVLTTMTITQTIRGPYDNLTWLLDSVEEIPYIRITRVAFDFEEDEDGYAATDVIALVFEVAMIKDSIIEAIENIDEPEEE